ncbi:AAA domain-containing protein [Haloferula sp. BvORR071]|uniref:AAA domain-containing protein n=1 Tax=Haloferula sp. BvORR071 TaxID=1396141 RepID=UPI00054D43B2|nr:AAA domain-containing protein [Haloferula sp. BvORR071]
MAAPFPPAPETSLPAPDPERLRFSGEVAFADALAGTGFFPRAAVPVLPDADQIRRGLLTGHLRLSENMAPEIFAWSARAVAALGLTKPVELYQAAGDENAANHICADVVFVSLQGRLISSLDEGSFLALLGHEFGHHLAHTDSFAGTPRLAAIRHAAAIARDTGLPLEARVLGSRVSMAMEFTADRFGAIAAGSIEGPIRLLMAIVTGLPAERLGHDVPTYLAQAHAIFDDAAKSATAALGSHPEHLLRAYALSLFGESDLFRSITGQGPGTRSIADVDAILAGILTASGEKLFDKTEEATLPPELQEFALAAAVLVATSDDDLDESEAKALEETFANLLPHWKDLLDPAVALARFDELLPLAISGGEPVALAIFNILLHITLADREIHIRELEVLAAVGRSLQQEHLFHYLLAAVAQDLRLDRSQRPVERPLPALPPGTGETRAALGGLFAGLSRRGGGSVALSRLLRILGEKVWQPALLQTLVTAAAPHHLEPAAGPITDENGRIRLEQPLLFRLTDSERHRREKAAELQPTDGLANAKDRDSLLTALKHLRERLVSGDGRSPSIRLYRASAGRHFDLARLDAVIAGRSERIVTQLYDSTTLPLLGGDEAGLSKTSAELASSLRALDREARARVEETGARDLHLGYPFLIGKVGPFFVRAPLILHPFALHGDSRGGGHYQLKRASDDTPLANQALLRLLFAKKGFPFTEELATELDQKAAESPEALLAALRNLGLDARPLTGAVGQFEDLSPAATELLPEGIALSENAVIGFFPQSSSDLLQDYDELLTRLDPASSSSLESSLNAACDILPASHRPAFAIPAHAGEPDQPVIYSDPSQRAAVRSSRAHRLLVVDGPPGTGKSQTIVNLVADTLARGGKVAVVCEKRVALDVVKQRLDAAGLGHLAAVVHDVHEDRKPLYTHIADRLENPERRSFGEARLTELRREARALETELAARSRLLASATASGLSVGGLHSFAAAKPDFPGCDSPSLASLPLDRLPALHRHLRELHPHSRHFAKSSPFHSEPPRASLATSTDDDLRSILAALRTTRETAEAYERAYAVQPLPAPALSAAREALQLAVQTPVADPLFPVLLGRRLDPPAHATLENSFAAVGKSLPLLLEEKSRVQFADSPELTAALATARQHVSSWLKFLKPAWRRARAIVLEALHRDWPDKAAAKLDPALLAAIERRLSAARGWTAAAQLFEALGMPSRLPADAATLATRHSEMLGLWETADRLSAARPSLESLGLWPLATGTDSPAGGWTAWSSRCQAALDLLAAQQAYFDAARIAALHFPVAGKLPPAGLAALEAAFHAEAVSLRLADQSFAQLTATLPNPLPLVASFADSFADAAPQQWCELADRAWAEAHLKAAEFTDPSLAMLDQAIPLGSPEAASSRLLELHQLIAAEESLRISAAGDRTGLMAVLPAEARVRRSPEQAARENLIKETRKQRRVTAMRTLVRQHAREILDVVPVWLMSPETTAILFPREPIFDLLIIDEASQCTVENGLPVLTRAQRAVVAGDDKQMPPSSFFKAGSSLEIDEMSEAEVAPDAFDSESLLVLARATGSGAPLRWHYRALFEELIAFSNHSMYGGSLLTIPATLSRSAPPAIRWVRVENGTWDKGSNAPEAKRVVDLLADLLARPKPPTVGIVTFNLSQRRTILDEIDARRSSDPAFSALWDAASTRESLDERPFVKNLESVQGDERELILFSLGYAPVPRKRKDGSDEIYVPARFGPLGQKGGERRLNVAVSRAKSEIIVVSSFEPSMLSVANTKHDGPRMFKAFVEFARHLGEGRRTQAEKILSLVNDLPKTGQNKASKSAGDTHLPLHHQLSLALEKEGLTVETLVGTSEFRLPVAVVSRGDHHRYALAILCEEGEKEADIYEDYVHVPNVLAHRGWRHLRITSRQWHRDPAGVIRRIRGMLESDPGSN